MSARVRKGTLYAHPARPEWGVGLVTALGEGRAKLAWSDGCERTILDPAARLVRVDPRKLAEAKPAAKPKREPKPKPPRAKPKPKPIREPNPADRRRWTAEDDVRLRELFEAGTGDDQIGEEMARTPKAVSANRSRLGLRRYSRARGIPEDVVEQILELRRRGAAASKIARTVGRSQCGVVGVLEREGLEPWLGPDGKRPWTAEDDRHLAELVEAGQPDRVIAEFLGRSRAAVARRRTDVLRVCKHSLRPWTEEEREAIRKCIAEGGSVRQLAEALGRGYGATRQRVIEERGKIS